MINLRFRRTDFTPAQVLEVWELKARNQTRHVRVVQLTDDGAAYVVPACNPPGERRQSRIQLDRYGRLDGYRFLNDPATRLTCNSREDAESCADFLHDKGCKDVYVDGRVVSVILPNAHTVNYLADVAEERKWAEPTQCAAIIAALTEGCTG
ncbi:hypothetical protein I0C86_40510 [Plantactinospora sp. S1510]|uniref:Uncharacterized protein n=1 Tax=Plantactinospora alkalitolerans TaxID=2789879 RepID=A0ABS0HA17_9ACTN|nr:hypothetical protein [Plantactinospora alkalitolerans]MBF9135164.1 hypothetical protein [Plantactinospora alkalitolerans]